MKQAEIRRPVFRMVTAGVLLGTLVLTSGCSLLPKEEEEPAPALAAPVKSDKATYTVRKGSILDKVTLRATLVPVQKEDLFFKNGGRLRAIYVKSGDHVKAGQLLAELFADDAEYQAAQARIQLAKAQLSLDEAQRKMQYAQNATTAADVKRAELDVQSAQLQVDHFQGLVTDSRLVAKFDGVVEDVHGNPGDNVVGYTPVVSVADPTNLWVEADVDSTQLAKLAVGQKALLDFSDIPDAGAGVVVQLPDQKAQATAPPNQAQHVEVKLDKVPAGAKEGMVGKVNVVLQEKKDVLLLENAAIRKFSNRTYVLLQDPRREVDVVTGIESDTETEITKGLKEGDVVIGR